MSGPGLILDCGEAPNLFITIDGKEYWTPSEVFFTRVEFEQFRALADDVKDATALEDLSDERAMRIDAAVAVLFRKFFPTVPEPVAAKVSPGKQKLALGRLFEALPSPPRWKGLH